MPAVRPARRSLPAGTLAALLGVVGALAVLAPVSQGRLMLHGCLSPGVLSPLGVRLALLSDAADCPVGSYGLGAAPRGAVLLLSVAVPALVAHLALVACGLGVGGLARAARDRLAALGARLVGGPARAATVPAAARGFVVVEHPRAVDRALLVVRSHRGPPRTA